MVWRRRIRRVGRGRLLGWRFRLAVPFRGVVLVVILIFFLRFEVVYGVCSVGVMFVVEDVVVFVRMFRPMHAQAGALFTAKIGSDADGSASPGSLGCVADGL